MNIEIETFMPIQLNCKILFKKRQINFLQYFKKLVDNLLLTFDHFTREKIT
jgi:hypothetical protein